jgi:hypothetical protein
MDGSKHVNSVFVWVVVEKLDSFEIKIVQTKIIFTFMFFNKI